MQYMIRIHKMTLPLITKLNDGVTPEVEVPATYFVYNPDGPNLIVGRKYGWDGVQSNKTGLHAPVYFLGTRPDGKGE